MANQPGDTHGEFHVSTQPLPPHLSHQPPDHLIPCLRANVPAGLLARDPAPRARHDDKNPSVGIAVWLIEPNLLDTTPQAQATAGIHLARPEGWIEILGGAVVSPTTENVASPVFDFRTFAAPARHLHLFGEVSTYTDALYGFAQVDVPIRKASGDVTVKLGVEAEGAKAWEGPGGFLAVGPHVIIPWNNHFTTMIAVQVRGTHQPAGPPATNLVGRLYAVIDF